MTKKELDAENDRLVETLEAVRRRLQQFQDVDQGALSDDDEEESRPMRAGVLLETVTGHLSGPLSMACRAAVDSLRGPL